MQYLQYLFPPPLPPSCRYKAAVDEEDYERVDRMLSALEQKDEMAQKMDAVKSLSVQVGKRVEMEGGGGMGGDGGMEVEPSR